MGDGHDETYAFPQLRISTRYGETIGMSSGEIETGASTHSVTACIQVHNSSFTHGIV